MDRTPVTSSTVASIGYDAQTQTLEVEFTKEGRIYQYFDVPKAVHNAFLASDSKGRFLASQIKGVYRYARL